MAYPYVLILDEFFLHLKWPTKMRTLIFNFNGIRHKMDIYVYVCIYTYAYIYTCMCVYYIYVCVCVCINMHICALNLWFQTHRLITSVSTFKDSCSELRDFLSHAIHEAVLVSGMGLNTTLDFDVK